MLSLISVVAKGAITDFNSLCIIKDETISFNNGAVVGEITAPGFKVNCAVTSKQLATMLGAIETAGGLTKCNATQHSLTLHAGSFKGRVPIFKTEGELSFTPNDFATGTEGGGGLLEALTKLKPFVGDRQTWMKGVYLNEGAAYATNGTVMVVTETGLNCPPLILPKASIDILLKLETITAYQASETHFTVWFPTGWVQLQCLGVKWPDQAKDMLEWDNYLAEDRAGLGNWVGSVSQLADDFGTVVLENNRIYLDGDFGGGVELEDFTATKRGYRAGDIGLLGNYLDHYDFTCNPAKFMGNKVAGIISGKEING